MALSVPHEGVVRQIQCKPGQMVERGAALILLGESDESGSPAL
jgi:biotin carboxyl carrier protein